MCMKRAGVKEKKKGGPNVTTRPVSVCFRGPGGIVGCRIQGQGQELSQKCDHQLLCIMCLIHEQYGVYVTTGTYGGPPRAQWFYVFSLGLLAEPPDLSGDLGGGLPGPHRFYSPGLRPQPPDLSGDLGGASQGPMVLRILFRPSARAARPIWGSWEGLPGPCGSVFSIGLRPRPRDLSGHLGGVPRARLS